MYLNGQPRHTLMIRVIAVIAGPCHAQASQMRVGCKGASIGRKGNRMENHNECHLAKTNNGTCLFHFIEQDEACCNAGEATVMLRDFEVCVYPSRQKPVESTIEMLERRIIGILNNAGSKTFKQLADEIITAINEVGLI